MMTSLVWRGLSTWSFVSCISKLFCTDVISQRHILELTLYIIASSFTRHLWSTSSLLLFFQKRIFNLQILIRWRIIEILEFGGVKLRTVSHHLQTLLPLLELSLNCIPGTLLFTSWARFIFACVIWQQTISFTETKVSPLFLFFA